jgi:hypothetical protein
MAGVLGAGAARAGEPVPPHEPAAMVALSVEGLAMVALSVEGLPLDELPLPVRERVRQVVQLPTLAAHAPVEIFPCQPELYSWLLDHHDRTALAWRRLGTRCVEITARGNGRFGWTDGQGSEVTWGEVHCGKRMRIWYAEGMVRVGVLLPAVPVRAVVVLRHAETRDERDRPVMAQQLSLFVHTDSKAAALAKRLFGASLPRMADQYVAQMELFFSALASYLQRHPEQVEPLLADAVQLPPSSGR